MTFFPGKSQTNSLSIKGSANRGENREVNRDKILGDFKNFLYMVWKFLSLPDPTPIQYEIADYLQYSADNKRKVIQAFRGVGKSWITSAFVLWSLKKNPDDKFLIVSASKSRADDFSTFTQKLINEMDFLADLRPKPDQRFSKVAFDVGPSKPSHAASVKSVGIYGQLTGSRANHIIADDVEVAQNSLTQDMREKLIRACTEFEAIIVPGGRITYLGTPQSEESIYAKLPDRGYGVRIWPSRIPKDAGVYKGFLAPSIQSDFEKGRAGSPTDPKRFSDRELLEREASYGRSGFALQFMLDTSLSDALRYPLKTSDLIVMNLNPDKSPSSIQYASIPDCVIKELPNVGFAGDKWYRPMFMDISTLIEYEGSVMSIDPSGRGQDELGYAIVKQLHGKLFVLDCSGLKGGYDDHNLLKLAKLAKQYKVNQVIIEENFGDGMFSRIFAPVLNSVHPCGMEEVKHSVQKEKRIIDTLEPVMNQHRLVVDYDLIKRDLVDPTDTQDTNTLYSLFYQLTRMTRDRGAVRHDDRVDALAIAVNYWVESMARDEDKAIDSYKTRVLDEQLRDFVKTCSPGKGKVITPVGGETQFHLRVGEGRGVGNGEMRWGRGR